MKRIKSFLVASIMPLLALAQSGVNYQAVVRDGSGNIIVNSQVTVNFKIRAGSTDTFAFEENHTPTTNNFGLINVVIGQGTNVRGVFADIKWGDTTHFLDITLNGINLGAIEFSAVPYAYHAESMTNVSANTNLADVEISTNKHITSQT